jgi:integrase
MMASFRKRNGKWQVRIQRLGYPDVSQTFLDFILAKKWATKIEREMDCGLFSYQPKKTFFKKLLRRYQQEILPTKKNTSADFYRINKLLTYPISQLFIEDIKSMHIVQFRDDLIEQHKSANTVRLYLAILSHVFTIAKTEWGYDNLNHPVLKVRRPRLPNARDRRLSDKEIHLICENTDSKILPIAMKIAVNTAMRLSEIIQLHPSNIHLDQNLIFLKDSKNGERRFIPLNHAAQQQLRPLALTNEIIFNVTSHSISNAFRRACRRAQIDGATFHTLRHEAISRMFEMGLNPMEVATISGHKSMQILKRYTHIKPEYLVKKLNGD